MERLTHRYTNGRPWTSMDNVSACGEYECVGPAIDRLATYEDAGLDPEEVRELAQAKDDRALVLPCKVGDTLYDTTLGQLSELTVRSIPIMIYPEHTYIGFNATNYRGAFLLVEMWQIGKTVFLTREEAEAALEAKKGGGGNG